MKIFLTALLSISLLFSCTNRSSAEAEHLPKDVSLKPELPKKAADSAQAGKKEQDTVVTSGNLTALRQEIENIISKVSCDDASKWRMSPFGAKPCGGPSSYIAYPKTLEAQLLPLIREYNQKNGLYNKQKGLMSDCAVVPAPASIVCEDGKAVLKNSQSDENLPQ